MGRFNASSQSQPTLVRGQTAFHSEVELPDLLIEGVNGFCRHAHRPLPADSEAAQAVAVLARAHQDAVWDRQQLINRLRCHLREYYPAALAAFHGPGKPGLDSPRARVVLTAAPTPADAARLTRSQLRALLKRAARPRCGIEAEVERLREIFRADYLHQLPQVEQALGYQARALLHQLDAACNSVAQLAAATAEVFLAHPDADIITSFPGLSV